MDDNKRFCWKCGKPHESGIKFCYYCGAAFATDDMHYQTDGRTVSAKDDKAYLSAPPPKYKKHDVGLILVLLIGALVIALILFTPSGEQPSPYQPDPEQQFQYPAVVTVYPGIQKVYDAHYKLIRVNFYLEDEIGYDSDGKYHVYTPHVSLINVDAPKLKPSELRLTYSFYDYYFKDYDVHYIGIVRASSSPEYIGIGEKYSFIGESFTVREEMDIFDKIIVVTSANGRFMQMYDTTVRVAI